MYTRFLQSGTSLPDMVFEASLNEEVRSKSVQLTGNGIDTNGLAEAMNEIGLLHPCKDTSEVGSHSDSCAHDNILKDVVNEVKGLSTKVSEMNSTNSKMIEVLIGLVKLNINVDINSGNVEKGSGASTLKNIEQSNKGKAIDLGSDDIENAKNVIKKIPNIDDITTVLISEDDFVDINDETTPYKGPTTLVFDPDASCNEISAAAFVGTSSYKKSCVKKEVWNDPQMVTKKLSFTPSPGGSSKKRKYETPQGNETSKNYLKSPPSKLGKSKNRFRPYKINPNLSTLPKFVKCKFRPTSDMKLSLNEIKMCAYIFRDDLEVRSDFQSLIPGGYVSKSILRMMSARVTWNQKHSRNPNMWCLPPAFASDVLMGMRQESLEIIYKHDRMTAYATLKLIYVPIREKTGHWFLMVVHIEERKIYHLDSHLLVDKIDSRHQKIKKIAKALSHLLLIIYNMEVPFCFLPDFDHWDIVEPRGVPNCGHSENSGLWVAEWMNMQSNFNNQVVGVLDDKMVRMKMAIRLLLKPHNANCKEMLEADFEKHWNKVTDIGQ
ncbi:hypothetical protein P8452_41621 [Trifolium repens]|nr:hypothetical protein P8452_41621 [Trifolium repens]